jgi:hypothetical protein
MLAPGKGLVKAYVLELLDGLGKKSSNDMLDPNSC